MNLYVDLATRRIVFSPKLNKEIARVDVKRGDVFPLSIVFIRNGKPVQINATPQIEFCAKSKNNLEGLALVYANSFTLTNASTNPSYNGTVAFNSAGLATILNNVAAEEDDLQFIDLHSEISWIDGTQVYTTSNLVLRVYNDVIKGNEVTPTPQPNQPVIFLYGIETSTIEGIDGGSVTVNGTLNANHIHGNIAGTLYTHVRTGEAMSKGDPFYISGFHVGSSQPIVMKADASNAAKMPAVGVMDADYANNTSGANGIISGTLSSINTHGYAVNSPIYVKDGGGYSSVAGTIRQQVGITERANTNTGAFIVTNSKVISSADITDFTTAVEAIAPNAVTSATTSDGTASLNISNLTLSQAITSGLQTKMVFTAEPTAVGDGQQIIWQWYNGGSPITTAAISSEATGSTTDKLIFQTTAGGSLGTSLDLTNTLATFSGSISSLGESYRATSTFTYASGAAAAHRTALGLTTLATTTPGTNVATFLETPTSANLASALTDENGTGGGFVRAEGATLTSPTLVGTPVFNATDYTYGAGAAAAHRTALGVTSTQLQTESLFSLLTLQESDSGSYTANSGTAQATQDGDLISLSATTANQRPNVYRFRNWSRNPGNSGSANPVMPLKLASAGVIVHSGTTANGGNFRCGIGMINGASAVAADANATAGRGFGWRIAWNSSTSKLEFNLWAHNGTTYSEGAGIDTGLGASNIDGFFNVIVCLAADGTVTANTWFGTNTALSTPSTTPTVTLAGGPTSGAFANQGIPLWIAAAHSTNAPSGANTIIARVINRKLQVG